MTETGQNIGSNGHTWDAARSGEIVRALTQDIKSGAVLTQQTLATAEQTLADQNVTVEPGEVPDPADALWTAKRTVVLFRNIHPARQNEVLKGKGVLIDIKGQAFSVGKV